MPNEVKDEKGITNYATVKEGTDPFNGHVCIFEDLDKATEDARFWVEHQRKDILSDYVTLAEAELLYNTHINDTMF